MRITGLGAKRGFRYGTDRQSTHRKAYNGNTFRCSAGDRILSNSWLKMPKMWGMMVLMWIESLSEDGNHFREFLRELSPYESVSGKNKFSEATRFPRIFMPLWIRAEIRKVVDFRAFIMDMIYIMGTGCSCGYLFHGWNSKPDTIIGKSSKQRDWLILLYTRLWAVQGKCNQWSKLVWDQAQQTPDNNVETYWDT